MKHYAITIALIALVACNEQPITTNYMCDNTAAQLDIISNKQATLRFNKHDYFCLLYTSPSPRDVEESRMPSSA